MSKISQKLVRYLTASLNGYFAASSGARAVQDEQFLEIKKTIEAYTERALKAIDARDFGELKHATVDFIDAQDGVGEGDAAGGTGMLGDEEFLNIAMRSMVRREFPTRNMVMLSQIALREAQGNPLPSHLVKVPLSQIE